MATLTQQDYQLKQGETPQAYNERIALARGDSPESLANIQSLTTQAISSANLAPTPSITPVTVPDTSNPALYPYGPGGINAAPKDAKGNPIPYGRAGNLVPGSSTPITPVPTPTADPNAVILSPEQQKYQTENENLRAMLTASLGEKAFTEELKTKEGIPGLEDTQADLGAQLETLKQEALGIPEGATTQHAREMGVSTAGLRSLQLNDLHRNRLETLLVSAHLDATNRRIASAERRIESAVDIKFGSLKEEIAVKRENLKLIEDSPQYSEEVKARAKAQDLIQANNEKKEDDLEKEQSEIWKLGVKVAENNTPATILNAINNAKTKEEALALAAPYLAKKAEDVVVADQRASRLLAVGLPTGIITTGGQLTKGNKDKITSKGVPPSTVDDITQAILEGNTLEEIRQALAQGFGKDVGFGYLDTFMQTLQQEGEEGIENPFK